MKEYNNEKKSDESYTPSESSDFEFLQEKIKERPINKKKLFKRMVLTASLATLFGVCACVSFLLLEPVLNNWIYPEEEPEIVTFPQEKDEMLPEDMLTEENISGQSAEVGQQPETYIDERFAQIVQNVNNELDNEQKINSAEVPLTNEAVEEEKQTIAIETQYDRLYKVYNEVSGCMVTVTAVHSELDLFNNTYQSEGSVAGVLIANNNKELLILTNKTALNNAESIVVSFCDGYEASAEIKQFDGNTNFAVLAVDLKYVKKETLDSISMATLGSSANSALTGSPIIAIGNLFGYKDNVCYGIVTSKGNSICLTDSEYNLITTDIYASKNPSGILVNISGEVIGIIDNSYNNEDTKNLLSAVGITELKGMITKLSNDEPIPYLGISAQNISTQAKKEIGILHGAYISNIEMDSPAMLNGIQKGDVIVRAGAQTVYCAADYMNALRNASFEEPFKMIVLRANKDGYEQMQFEIQPTQHPLVKKELEKNN